MARLGMSNALQNGLGGGGAQFRRRLAHHRKRRIEVSAPFKIVKADDGYVPRTRKAQFANCHEHAQSHSVVAHEHGGRAIAQLEELSGAPVAGVFRVVAGPDELRFHGSAMSAQRLFVTRQALSGVEKIERLGDDADSSVAELQQVFLALNAAWTLSTKTESTCACSGGLDQTQTSGVARISSGMEDNLAVSRHAGATMIPSVVFPENNIK